MCKITRYLGCLAHLTCIFAAIGLFALDARSQPASQAGRKITTAKSDRELYKRIELVRRRANRIIIDGKGNDWQGIPLFVDPAGDARGNANLDIVRTGIAPREKDLLLYVATAGKPSPDSYAFWFYIDILGASLWPQAHDLQVNLNPSGKSGLIIYPENGTNSTKYSGDIQVAIGDVVEARIPYSVLEKALPAGMAQYVNSPKSRPWMRVTPVAWNKKVADYGASVASYRLTRNPIPLDPPLPKPGKPATIVELPVKGQWYIGQGAHSIGTHWNQWGYDLWLVDHTLHFAKTRDSGKNEDHYCWNKPVFAPVKARVVLTRDDLPDRPVSNAKNPAVKSNMVNLDLGNGHYLSFGHLRQRSVKVRIDQIVQPATVLGHVGYSGINSDGIVIPYNLPRHLHLNLFKKAAKGWSTAPLAFANVRVGLNPGQADPWARSLPSWQPREGFFVERSKPFGK